MHHLYLLSLVASCVISLGVTPLFIYWAKRRNYLDHPTHRKNHEKPVAYLGGLAIFITVLVTLGINAWLNPNPLLKQLTSPSIRKLEYILICTLGMLFIGLWDDLGKPPIRYKFLGQLFFTSLFVFGGYRFDFFYISKLIAFHLGIFAIPFTIFWMLSIINAINMIDGLDGLAASVTIGSLFFISMAAGVLGNSHECILSLATLGALLGWIGYNWSPAKMYLGDSGSNALGMLIAGLLASLGCTQPVFPLHPLSHPKVFQAFPYQIIVVTLMVAYPVIEIILSVFRRLLRGSPISRADKGHIHHRFLKLGWSPAAICGILLLSSLFPGTAALAILTHEYELAIGLLLIFGLLFGISLPLLGFLNFLEPKSLILRRPHFLIANHFIQMQELKLPLIHDPEEIFTLLTQTCIEFGVQGYKISVPSKKIEHSWERPLDEHRAYLTYLKTDLTHPDLKQFHDKIFLENNDGKAYWIFDPYTEEVDLDIEYRVLISDLMKKVLLHLAHLSLTTATHSETQVHPQVRISSKLLNRQDPLTHPRSSSAKHKT
jgi:UDP-GlcNAc:undecaprenyl-phosphate GlcNAc-1-phosphate transferase